MPWIHSSFQKFPNSVQCGVSMVLNSVIFFLIILGLIIWLIIISVLLYKVTSHYNHLVENTSKNSLKEILEVLLSKQEKILIDVNGLEQKIDLIQREALSHIQRVGIVRYNPFADTGGSQSFSLALLDGKDNGLVMTSLFARTGNRWYIKYVKEGKGLDLDLSKEEHQAIEKAKKMIDLKI